MPLPFGVVTRPLKFADAAVGALGIVGPINDKRWLPTVDDPPCQPVMTIIWVTRASAAVS